MRENRLYGSEGGESQLNAISLPLSSARLHRARLPGTQAVCSRFLDSIKRKHNRSLATPATSARLHRARLPGAQAVCSRFLDSIKRKHHRSLATPATRETKGQPGPSRVSKGTAIRRHSEFRRTELGSEWYHPAWMVPCRPLCIAGVASDR